MHHSTSLLFATSLFGLLVLQGCGDGSGSTSGTGGTGGDSSITTLTNVDDGPAAGNPDGHCDVPAEAAPEDVSIPPQSSAQGRRRAAPRPPSWTPSRRAESSRSTAARTP